MAHPPVHLGVILKLIWLTLVLTIAYHIFPLDLLSLFGDNLNYRQTAINGWIRSDPVLTTTRPRMIAATTEEDVKIIFAWTSFFSSRFEDIDWMGPCADLKCRVTSDRRLLPAASAVVFHMRNFNWFDLPDVRLEWQRYVFMLLESPYHSGNVSFDIIPHFFNWTMTYRADSDIPMPYGSIQYDPIPSSRGVGNQELSENDTAALWNQHNYLLHIFRGKSIPIAWFVSNCNSPARREQYFSELKRHITVHQYGSCGSGWGNCTKDATAHCDRVLERDYYFYIAVENSICKDYITEKLWSRLDKWSVPIVLKRSLYTKVLPVKSFIALDDFRGPHALAVYLQSLINDSAKYLEYFQWRFVKNVQISIFPTFYHSRDHGMCLLCQRLRNQTEPRKMTSGLDDWWFKQANCRSNTVLKILNPGLKIVDV